MNKNLEMRKEKIVQEMKELKVEILNEYLQTAKEWDEAVQTLLSQEKEFVEGMSEAEVNLLHKELLLITDETAIEKQNEILRKYTTSIDYWEFITKMDDLKFAYEDVKMAERILETTRV